jgi:hypothetical protein
LIPRHGTNLIISQLDHVNIKHFSATSHIFGVDLLNIYIVGLCRHAFDVATTIVKGVTFLEVLLRLFWGPQLVGV